MDFGGHTRVWVDFRPLSPSLRAAPGPDTSDGERLPAWGAVDIYWYVSRDFENACGPHLEHRARLAGADPLRLQPLDQADRRQMVARLDDLHLGPVAEGTADELGHPLSADRRVRVVAPAIDQEHQEHQGGRVALQAVQPDGEGHVGHKGLHQTVAGGLAPALPARLQQA